MDYSDESNDHDHITYYDSTLDRSYRYLDFTEYIKNLKLCTRIDYGTSDTIRYSFNPAWDYIRRKATLKYIIALIMYTLHRFAPEGVSAEGYTLEETAILNERYAAVVTQYNTLKFYKQIDYNAVEQFLDPVHKSYAEIVQMVLLQVNKESYDGIQCLLPCTTSMCKYTFGRQRDLITAVYVPIDIERVKLHVRSDGDSSDERMYSDSFNIIGNEFILDSQLYSDNKSIDELLEECKLTPAQSNVNIDSLLEASRLLPTSETGDDYIHNGCAETITISGETYQRLVFIEPYIPTCSLFHTRVEIIFDRNVTFYTEVVTLETDIRRSIGGTNSVLYTKYSSDPVIVLEAGRLFNYGKRPVNDEQSYAASVEEIQTVPTSMDNIVRMYSSSILSPEIKAPNRDMSQVTVVHAPMRPTLCSMKPIKSINSEYVDESIKMNDD